MTLSNNPPAHEAMAMHIEDLFAMVSNTVAGATVTNDEQEATLDGLLDDVRTARKDADGQRAAEKKPHDDAAKAVQTTWKPLLERCDLAANEIKRLLTPYRDAKQRAKDEAARQARQEAQAREEQARAAMRDPDDLQARFAAEQDLKAAKKLTAVANSLNRAPSGLRTRWVATLTDPAAALKYYRECEPEALKAWLLEQGQREANNGARTIPGFTIAQERKAA